MKYLGAFLTGFLLVGAVYHPEVVAVGGILAMWVCAAMLPVTVTIWVIQQIIKEFKA